MKNKSFAAWVVGLLFCSNCVVAQTVDTHVTVSFDTNAYKYGKYYIIKSPDNDTVYQSSVCRKDSLLLDNRFEYKFIYPVKVERRRIRYGYFMLSFSDHYFYDEIAIRIDKYTDTKHYLKTNVLIHSGEKGKAAFTKPLPE